MTDTPETEEPKIIWQTNAHPVGAWNRDFKDSKTRGYSLEDLLANLLGLKLPGSKVDPGE